jgi:hypothetical protein
MPSDASDPVAAVVPADSEAAPAAVDAAPVVDAADASPCGAGVSPGCAPGSLVLSVTLSLSVFSPRGR